LEEYGTIHAYFAYERELNLNTQSEFTKVEKDLVVSLEYTLTVDGEVIDSSEENGAIDFIQGAGNIISGLEKELTGMKLGESKKVNVLAKDAYGEYDPEAVEEIPLSDFPNDIPLEVGVELAVEDEDGEAISAVIEEVGKDTVNLNFNHPLAGKDLTFDVKIAGIRAATAEELEHGHVHGDEEGCDCEEGDCDCEDGGCNCGGK
jgi:FKBP-type peptidyl-prolyl cis-trans isomerase SlyD